MSLRPGLPAWRKQLWMPGSASKTLPEARVAAACCSPSEQDHIRVRPLIFPKLYMPPARWYIEQTRTYSLPLKGDKMPRKLAILFLCTGNSCRSQMAEGFANHLKPDEIQAYSAGIETHGINPLAVTVMAEAGVDISDYRSKHLDEFKDTAIDAVVTLCSHAHETCPWFPGKAKVIHRGFDDPPKLAAGKKTDEEKLDCYRKVRNDIRDWVLTLPRSLSLIG